MFLPFTLYREMLRESRQPREWCTGNPPSSQILLKRNEKREGDIQSGLPKISRLLMVPEFL
jgi:hypothetical protein